MIAIDPATAKAIFQVVITVLKDEETRKRVLAIVLAPVITVVMVLSFAFYILTNPIEFLGGLISKRYAHGICTGFAG